MSLPCRNTPIASPAEPVKYSMHGPRVAQTLLCPRTKADTKKPGQISQPRCKILPQLDVTQCVSRFVAADGSAFRRDTTAAITLQICSSVSEPFQAGMIFPARLRPKLMVA